MNGTVKVVVGTPIYRAGAFILNKFLANQKEIQQNYPLSELVFATNEEDFAKGLEGLLRSWELKGKVIRYQTVKPDYARSSIWNIACSREATRQYVLSQPEASYLLFLDADMTFDPNVIKIMEWEIQGYDVVHSGYALRGFGIGLVAQGCMMLSRDTLEKVKFRCLEFKSGDVIPEDILLEMDLIRLRSKIRKGFFLSISHYKSENKARHINPQPVGVLRRIANSAPVRYALIRASIVVHHEIPRRLQVLLYRLLKVIRVSASTKKRS